MKQQYIDEYIKHIINIEFYAENRAEVLTSFMNKLYKELEYIIISYGIIKSKTKENECIKECNQCIKKHISNWKTKEEEERKEQVKKESNWLINWLSIALAIILTSSSQKLENALETPFNATDTFESFVDDMELKIKKIIYTPLRLSRVFGSSTSSFIDSLKTSFEKEIKNAQSNMRSSVTALQRNTAYQIVKSNKLKFIYVSMLDDNVCVVCGGYSGEIYEDLSEAPFTPIHNRCRCYYMPLPLSDSYQNETYSSWFNRQPDSVQYKILGSTRYNLYKSGVTNIKNFSANGRKLNLKELFSKEDF